MGYKIGIDVGGTFTDFLLVDADGGAGVFKTPSTPADPSIGVMNGLTEMADSLGLTVDEFAKTVDLIVHGTTVTTNAVLTSNGAKTGVLTTDGFRDILEMRRGFREQLYNNKLTQATPLVPRDRRVTVVERMDVDGQVVTALDKESVRSAARALKDEAVDAVAICFVHSYANPVHEEEAKTIVREELPDAYLTVSHELLPQVRLYDRISSSVLNSYVGPILARYLKSLTKKLADSGFSGVLLIMQSNGGVATPETTEAKPVMTLLSGPAGGPVAGITFAGAQGYKDCITVDMGGTSFDAALVQDGVPLLRSEGWINRQRLALPMLDIHTIGAGGGSIGWIDDGGLLRMGPQSAGADPGPACYGHGGTLPTCSDANLVLGYLNADFFLGGRMKLDMDAAYQAIDTHVAKPLGLSVEDAAAGMFQVMNVNMAAGIREITTRRGIDPREFPLVVAGGAGPIHGALIAEEMEIPIVLVPKESSIFCAGGMLRSDLKHSYVRTYHTVLSRAELPPILLAYRQLEKHGSRILADEGVHELGRVKVEFGADMRYLGQHNEITFDFDIIKLEQDGLDYLADAFHSEHDRLFGYSLRGTPTDLEIVNLRVTAIGLTDKPGMQKMAQADPDSAGYRKGTRPVYIPEDRSFHHVNVYDGERMVYGNMVAGPAIIEQITTSTLVPPGYNMVVDSVGTFCLYKKEIEHTYLRRVMG